MMLINAKNFKNQFANIRFNFIYLSELIYTFLKFFLSSGNSSSSLMPEMPDTR